MYIHTHTYMCKVHLYLYLYSCVVLCRCFCCFLHLNCYFTCLTYSLQKNSIKNSLTSNSGANLAQFSFSLAFHCFILSLLPLLSFAACLLLYSLLYSYGTIVQRLHIYIHTCIETSILYDIVLRYLLFLFVFAFLLVFFFTCTTLHKKSSMSVCVCVYVNVMGGDNS